jgi:uncharacterized phiE125 gp8 family phage protein
MTARQLLAATELAVSVEDAMLSLKVDQAELEPVVRVWLRGVIRHAESIMQRSIVHQTWLDTSDGFPMKDDGCAGAIKLRYPPVVEVLSVKYYDQDNVLRTLHPDDYEVDSVSEPGWVVPAPGKAWPATFSRINAVQVEFKCGYGPDATSTPDEIRLYILAKLVEQFDPSATPRKRDVGPTFIDGLLDRLVVYG